MDKLVNKINLNNVENPHLKKLLEQLQGGHCSEVDVLRMTPQSAQKMPLDWNHHQDHSDYTENKHTDSSQPSHGDYCD